MTKEKTPNFSDSFVMPESRDEVTAFWGQQAKSVDWFKSWDNIYSVDKNNKTFWFKGAVCNTCYNALDRHVKGNKGDKTAIIYESPITNSKTEYISYSLLLKRVKSIASVLIRLGVTKGDRVIIYMPMIPEAVIGVLACARIGAVHSVVFGGSAAAELAKRIEHSDAKVVLSASCGIEPSGIINYKKNLDNAIKSTPNQVNACLIYQRPELQVELNKDIDKDWLKEENSVFNDLQVVADCTAVKSTDPLYILYTSGTTGQPKGVVRDNGGYMVALMWSLKSIYNISENDVFWTASDIGWVVGHSYIVYAPLLLGCTTVLFEGKPVGTPDAGVFWRTIEKHRVKVLFTAPTALRAIIRKDPLGKEVRKSDISSLQTLFLAGERSDPETLNWAKKHLNVPAIDHWWQTETGWSICANLMGINPWKVILGAAGKAMPGYNISILNDNGKEVENGVLGSVCIKMPLPPGCFNSLWKDEQAYQDKYLKKFKGYYETGDAGYKNADGYVFIMSRTDDVINTAGHRLSTGLLEEVVLTHPAIAECAVFGIKDSLKGQVPCCLYIKKDGVTTKDLSSEIKSLVRLKVGAIASLKRVISVNRLPKTRSGKILRSTMAKMISGDAWSIPATVDDPLIFDEINAATKETVDENN